MREHIVGIVLRDRVGIERIGGGEVEIVGGVGLSRYQLTFMRGRATERRRSIGGGA